MQESGNTASAPQFATVAEFKTALAKALLRVAREEAVGNTSSGSVMRQLGLPRPVASGAGDEDFTIPAIEEPETVPGGYKRSDLTASKLAELDYKALYEAPRGAYRHIRSQVCDYGHLTEDQAVEICKAVGLPVPATKTNIIVNVTGFGNPSWIVDGEVSEERVAAIRAHFAQKVKNPVNDAIREIEPDVQGLSDDVMVTLYPSRNWPPFPAFVPLGESATA